MRPPSFPEFLDPALRGGPLPEAIAAHLAIPRFDTVANRLETARLFWERDLTAWERKAALKIAAIGGVDLAGNFINCGRSQYGHFQDLAPLREAERAYNLSGYLASAYSHQTPENKAPLTRLQRARLGFQVLALVPLAPYSSDSAVTRALTSLIVATLCALPAAGLALELAVGSFWLAAAATPALGAVSLLAFSKIGADLQGTQNGLNRLASFPLLREARRSGLRSRLRSAFQKPPLLRLGKNFLDREDGVPYEEMSDAIRSRISEEDYQRSRDPKALPASLSLGEALDLRAALPLASAPDPQPRAPLFSRLARRLGLSFLAKEPQSVERAAGSDEPAPKKSRPRL